MKLARGTVCALALAACCFGESRFDGVWVRAYNSQPTELHADPAVNGEFLTGDLSLPIRNGKLFGTRACFDVVTGDGDMRWCVEVKGDRLEGTWSGGPQGGPMLGGAGAGARTFPVSGKRVAVAR
jgi:hypothetical protein